MKNTAASTRERSFSSTLRVGSEIGNEHKPTLRAGTKEVRSSDRARLTSWNAGLPHGGDSTQGSTCGPPETPTPELLHEADDSDNHSVYTPLCPTRNQNCLSPFYLACKNNDLEKVKDLSKRKIRYRIGNDSEVCYNIGKIKEGKHTLPMEIASKQGHGEIVLFLSTLDRIRTGKSLLYAYKENHIRLVKVLLDDSDWENEAIPEGTLLHLACERGDEETVGLLMNHPALMKNCVRESDQASPFYIAIEKGHLKIAKMLLQYEGLDVATDARGYARGQQLPELQALVKSNRERHHPLQFPRRFVHYSARKAIATVQNAVLGHHAIEKLQEIIDIRKSLQKHESIAQHGFSEAIRQLILILQKAATRPHYQQHGTTHIDEVLRSGRLLSSQRLTTLGISAKGAADKNDKLNHAHYFVFAGMGADRDNLPRLGGIEATRYFSSIVFNVDLWHEYSPAVTPFQVVKGKDWGEMNKTVIHIPNTRIFISRPYDDTAHFRNPKKNGPHQLTQKYAYHNKDTGYAIEYRLHLLDEVVSGLHHSLLVPDLIAQHLQQLPASEQLSFLSGVASAVGDEKKQEAARALLDAFNTLESSIGGILPLKLEYTDKIVFVLKPDCTLSQLRDHVKLGELEKTIDFIGEHSLLDMPWIIEGVHDIALKEWNHCQHLLAVAEAAGPSRVDAKKYQDMAGRMDGLGATLAYITPGYRQHVRSKEAKTVTLIDSHADALLDLQELYRSCMTPSQINAFVGGLRAAEKQEKIIAFLASHEDEALKCLSKFREFFRTMPEISLLGLQSTLRKHLLDDADFQSFISDKSNIRILLYLVAVTDNPNAVAALSEPLSTLTERSLFSDNNGYTKNRFEADVTGMTVNGKKMNASILADLVFNIPPTAIFVPLNSNSRSPGEAAYFDFIKAENTAYAYQLFFGNMRLIAREENLGLAMAESEERRLQESYDASQWPRYIKRFENLAEQSRHTAGVQDRGADSLRTFRGKAQEIIDQSLVLEARFSHSCLDPRHLQSVLGHDYGNFRETFVNLLTIVAASPSHDDVFETTAIQLFHRMKLLEYEFYKLEKIALIQEQEVL